VAQVAARQWGNIRTAQLRRCGVSEATQARWTEQRLLWPRHQGVFSFGAPTPAPEAKWAAALLAAGPGAALSHRTAMAHYGHLPVREVTEVRAPKQRRGDETLAVYRGAFEWTTYKGLPTTTVAQTLLDLAAIRWPIDRLTHEAAASGLVPLDDLKAFALRRRGARGARALRAALALPHTRSGKERRFLTWLKQEGLPQPEANPSVSGLTPDFVWPDRRLVIELDDPQTHGSAYAQRRDPQRDARLEANGWRVERVEGPDERIRVWLA
jgi:very-short-patch-repair endonuclease